MNNGPQVMVSDLHIIETGEISERWYFDPERGGRPQFLKTSLAIFSHWNVRVCLIRPLAHSKDVIGPQKSLNALNDGAYGPIRKHGYDDATTRDAMDMEGIDWASSRFHGHSDFR